MKRRSESLNVADNLMLELFLQCLQSSVQTILAAVSELTLDKAAEIADRIIEVSPSTIETFAVSNKNEQSLEAKLFLEIERLNKRIDRLSFSRGRSPYRQNKNSRKRSIFNARDFSICWFSVSDRAVTAISSSVLHYVGLITSNISDLVVAENKLLREKAKVGKDLKFQALSEAQALPLKGLYFDGRKDSTLTEERVDTKRYTTKAKEERLCLIEELGSRYITHLSPLFGTAKTDFRDYYRIF
ncbi:hypothetical protein AVEN_104045-1 [Araneus ventricosus]|uniref:Uncharacterized protein n=1 Tax=Araneus ventricosus TaxID=182803 RepID=A0A4Y2LLN0_ARAVE|nr:hypothetical protein AVEN_104045-1 [Araneus ventricosus]